LGSRIRLSQFKALGSKQLPTHLNQINRLAGLFKTFFCLFDLTDSGLRKRADIGEFKSDVKSILETLAQMSGGKKTLLAVLSSWRVSGYHRDVSIREDALSPPLTRESGLLFRKQG